MRPAFVAFIVLAGAFIAAATPSAAAEPCRAVSLRSVAHGPAYVAIFYDARTSDSDAFATFYADGAAYAAKFRLRAGRRPMEIAFSSPGTRPLHGAAFTFGDDASACVVRTPVRLVPPSTERVLESADQFQEQFEIASPVILTKAGTSGSPARCATRFLAAEIMGPPAAPSYPDIAREQGATGTASVLVRSRPTALRPAPTS